MGPAQAGPAAVPTRVCIRAVHVMEVFPDGLEVALQCRGHMAPHASLGHASTRGGGLVWTGDVGSPVGGLSSLFKAWLKGKPWALPVLVLLVQLAPRAGCWEILGRDSILAAAEHVVQRWGLPCQRARAHPSADRRAMASQVPVVTTWPLHPVEPQGLEAPAGPRQLRGPRRPRAACGFLVRRRLTRAPRALVTRVTPCPALPSGPPSVFVLGFLCLYF